MSERITDERFDLELRRFLAWQADDVHGAPSPADVAAALGARGVAGRRSPALSTDEVSSHFVTRLRIPAATARQDWRKTIMSNTFKIALAAAAALVFAAALGLFLSQPSELVGPPAASPSPGAAPILAPTPSAVEIAEAYIEARNAYDPERARELIADNFATNEPPNGFVDVGSLELAFENHRAYGFHYSEGDCRERGSAALTSVVCDYLWTTEVHRISGQPATPAQFTFSLSDGRISRVFHDASFDFYFGPGSWYDGFLTEHPDFRELVDGTHELDPGKTRAAIELLPEYFELYEEWLKLGPTLPLPLPDWPSDLEAGRYALDSPDFPVRITFDVPDGWSGAPGRKAASAWKRVAGVPAYSLMVAFWIVDGVSADPCATDSMDWGVGPTADDLATAIAGWPGFDVSRPTDVTLDGYQGKSLEFTVPDDSEHCFGGDFDLWRSGGVIRGANEGNQSQLWILDVDGVRLVVEVVDFPGSSEQDRAESGQIFESIQIEKP
jgi:hypothetical protein